VTGYPVLFREYINSNLDNLTLALQDLGLQVVSSQAALPALLTDPPTESPTTSMPSVNPSAFPTGPPSATPLPPSFEPSSEVPTPPPPAPSQKSQIGTGAIIGVAFVAIVALLVALVLFYRYRKRLQEKALQERAGSPRRSGESGALGDQDPSMLNEHGEMDTSLMAQGGMVSPSDSLVSRKSLLSEGDSLDEGQSGDEADGTENLKDEFDVYRNEELEIMRSKVEGNVAGGDGMMSQALTSVLMEDDDPEGVDQWVVTWGGTGDSMEIEASALCEVNDWVKRKEAALEDERYVDSWAIVRD
jgi:hypothetical protein